MNNLYSVWDIYILGYPSRCEVHRKPGKKLVVVACSSIGSEKSRNLFVLILLVINEFVLNLPDHR